MIETCELKIIKNKFNIETIKIDFENKLFFYFLNDKKITQDVPFEKVKSLLSSYIPYWNNEYINNYIIDGNETYITIKTNEEMIKYIFKNKFPNNYNEFIELFNEMIGINNGK